MKRILSIMLMLTMVMAATAEEDKLNVNGNNVLKISGGCSNVSLGQGNGTYSYNPDTKELILNNAKITRTGSDNNAIYCNIRGVTIRFKGNCEFNTEASGIHVKQTVTFYNEGTLTINSTGYRGIYIQNTDNSALIPNIRFHGGTWNITAKQQGIEGVKRECVYMYDDDPDHPFYMKVKGSGKGAIYDLTSLTLDKLGIGYPWGAVFNETKHAVCPEGSSTIAGIVIITTLAFELGGRQWTTYNQTISGPNISGTVTYTASSKTVKLNNATVKGAFTPHLDGMTLISTQTNTLSPADGGIYCMFINKDNLTIRGGGTLNTGPIRIDNSTSKTTTISGGVTVNVTSSENSISGFEGYSTNSSAYLVIDNSTLNVNVKSGVSCIPPYVSTKLIGSVVSSPANIVRLSYSPSLSHYSQEVNNEYASFCDIDRETPHQGSLSIVPGIAYNVWVNGVQVNSKNYSNLSSALNEGGTCSYNPNTNTLTLNKAKISYEDGGHSLYPAIYNKINGLVINNTGTSEIGGDYHGIESEADFTITGNGHLKVTGTGVIYGGIKLINCNLTVNNTELTVTGGKYGIYESGQDTGKRKVILNNSYLHLTSNPDISGSMAVAVKSFDPNCQVVFPVNGIIKYGYIYESDGKTYAKKAEIEPKKGISTAIDAVAPIEESSETSIYTTSGTLVWQGAGQPQLPRGIYIMKKNGKVQKVQKN